MAVLPSCACDCERDLSDPETAFLGLLCDSTFCDPLDPFLWVLWVFCCAVIELLC